MGRSRRPRNAPATREKAINAFMALMVLVCAVLGACFVTMLIFANAYWFDNAIDLHVIVEAIKILFSDH